MSTPKKLLTGIIASFATVGVFFGGCQVRQNQELGAPAKELTPVTLPQMDLPSSSSKKIGVDEYFYQLVMLLERDFVDPITDENKLAYGAIKGLVNGLWDPLSQYFPADHYKDEIERQSGIFHGIGAEIRLAFKQDELEKVRKNGRSADPLMLLPEIQVAFVAPKSPADRAGIRVGDVITQINGKWLISWKDVKEIRDLQAAVTKGTITQQQFSEKRTLLQKKVKSTMTTPRALDLLMSGEGKSLDIVWNSQGIRGQNSIVTAKTEVSPVVVAADGSIQLHLFKGASQVLQNTQIPSKTLTLDLRNSGLGSYDELVPVLEQLAPKGDFGSLVAQKDGHETAISTQRGRNNRLSFDILVDQGTRGAAAVLALALRDSGLATLKGVPNMSEAVGIQMVSLDDGSGYTLNFGQYKARNLEARK